MLLNDGEKLLYEFKNSMTGSFFTHLFNALFVADTHNFARLAMGFPEEANAVKCFMTEPGYWEKLEKRYQNWIDSNR